MDRPRRRRLNAAVGLVLGLGLIALTYRDPLAFGHREWFFAGIALATCGFLALIGVNIWKGGWLDPRWDHGEPAPPFELLRTERMAEDLARPGQRWLPIDFANFPDRCVACGQPPVGSWNVIVQRGIDLIVFALHQTNSIAAPVCARCRRRRRLASLLAFSAILLPFLLLYILDEELGWVTVTMPIVFVTLGLTFLAAAFFRTWSSPILDRALLGVSGIRLEKGGRSGYFHFRSRELATEVVALTRSRMHEAAGTHHHPKVPTWAGTS